MSDLTDEAANEILQNAEWCKFSDAREMIQEVYAMGYAHAAAVLAAERITAAHWQSLAEANMALAVSANKRMAAKDAEIAGLRADNTRLQNEVVMPLRERVRVLEDALTKIDAIRNDIIGRQKIGWSSHVYPLVAALDEAGYPGMEYEAARAALGDKTPNAKLSGREAIRS